MHSGPPRSGMLPVPPSHLQDTKTGSCSQGANGSPMPGSTTTATGSIHPRSGGSYKPIRSAFPQEIGTFTATAATIPLNSIFLICFGVLLIVFREKVADGQVKVSAFAFKRNIGDIEQMKFYIRVTCIIVGCIFILSTFNNWLPLRKSVPTAIKAERVAPSGR